MDHVQSLTLTSELHVNVGRFRLVRWLKALTAFAKNLNSVITIHMEPHNCL